MADLELILRGAICDIRLHEFGALFVHVLISL